MPTKRTRAGIGRPTSRRPWSIGAALVATVVLASCGSDDDAEREGVDATTTVDERADASTTVDEQSGTTTTVHEQDAVTTTVGEQDDTTTTATEPEATTTTTTDRQDDTTTTIDAATTTTTTAAPDDAALALIARGLYSVPGAGTHCEIDPDGAFGRYAFPADGGDIYALCIVLAAGVSDALGPASVQLTTPDGSVVVDVEITEAENPSDDRVGGRLAVPLVLRYESGRQILHGARISLGDAESELSIPIFLPHDRPAGDWTVTYDIGGGQSGLLPVDRPCATSAGGTLPDPIDIDPDLAFTREGPVTFPHCRAFPDVVGDGLADARSTIDTWAANLGSTVDYSIQRTCGTESVVTATSPPAGVVATFAVGAPDRFVSITEQIVCPDVPDLLDTDYDEAVIVLDDLVARFPGFEWTSVGNCQSGTVVTVQDPSPAPGTVTAVVELNNCAPAG